MWDVAEVKQFLQVELLFGELVVAVSHGVLAVRSTCSKGGAAGHGIIGLLGAIQRSKWHALVASYPELLFQWEIEEGVHLRRHARQQVSIEAVVD